MAGVPDRDQLVRIAAFSFLERLEAEFREWLPYERLIRGFEYADERVPLLGPQGIFKPRVLDEMPLSITTAPVAPGKSAPYADRMSENGTIEYCYRGTDPSHRDNIGLRLCMQRRVPLVYLHGLVPGRYAAWWPAYVIADDPTSLRFCVRLDKRESLVVDAMGDAASDDMLNARREYVTVWVQRRMHQQCFRERVIAAYRQVCAICRLRHERLLDAAHILPDTHPRGDPIVPNGLALCKLHHAAFDSNILGVDPDLRVRIRQDILEEVDGPMLVHGIQGFDGCRLAVPRNPALVPDRDRVAERYAQFRSAS